MLFCPQERVRITPLAGEEERAETGQIVLAHVIAIWVFALDRAKRCRRRKQDSHAMLGDHPPERARIGSADWFPLVKHRRIPIEQGCINYIRVADDPSHI